MHPRQPVKLVNNRDTFQRSSLSNTTQQQIADQVPVEGVSKRAGQIGKESRQVETKKS